MNVEPLLQNVTTIDRTLSAGQMTPLHVHEREEAVLVVEGRITVLYGDEAVTLEAGETFVAPARIPHTMRIDSERARIRLSTEANSSARYEDFLRAFAWPNNEFTPQESSTLAAIATPNAITVLGTPGMLPADLNQP